MATLWTPKLEIYSARSTGYVSALFMDLSKAFDTINHDLLIAKLKAYDFSTEALTLMKSYLKNRRQKVVQINNNFSSERDVIAGVPQGSIDAPFFSICL